MAKKQQNIQAEGVSAMIPKAYALCDFRDKEARNGVYITNFLAKTNRILCYKNLPEEINRSMMENIKQKRGYAVLFKHEGKFYVTWAGLGGDKDAYYLPKYVIVNNPWIGTGGFNKILEVDKDCVILRNDSLYQGLLPIINQYTSLLVENDISMLMNNINSRLLSILTADNDTAKVSAETFLKQLENGKQGIIGTKAFLEGIKSQPVTSTNSNTTTQLIEMEQYLKASLSNELGILANYNMKRESINSNEAQLNNEYQIPLIEDMLQCAKEDWDKANKLFGLEVEPDLDSLWKRNHEEVRREIEQLELPISQEELSPEEAEDVLETTNNETQNIVDDIHKECGESEEKETTEGTENNNECQNDLHQPEVDESESEVKDENSEEKKEKKDEEDDK